MKKRLKANKEFKLTKEQYATLKKCAMILNEISTMAIDDHEFGNFIDYELGECWGMSIDEASMKILDKIEQFS